MNSGVHSDVVWHRLLTTTPCPSSDFPACSGDHPSWYLAPWQPRLMQTSGMVSTSGKASILDGKVSQIGFLKYSRGSLWKEVFEMKSSVLPPKRQAWGFRVCASSQSDCWRPPPVRRAHPQAKHHGLHLPIRLPVPFTCCEIGFISPKWRFGGWSLILRWCFWWM